MTLDCVGATLMSLHIIDNCCRSVQLYGAAIPAQLGQVEYGQGFPLFLFSSFSGKVLNRKEPTVKKLKGI